MPDIDLASIAPVSDAEAARLASPVAFADLATRIAATGAPVIRPGAGRPDTARPRRFRPPLSRPRPGGRRPGSQRPRRRLALLTSFPVALAAVAALLVTVLGPGGGGADSGANSQAAIQALSFTKADGYVTVIIRNPWADASWYNADFARHHLPLTLNVVPASPSLAGQIVAGDGSVQVQGITGGKRQCFSESMGETYPCIIGFRVPANLHDQSTITIGGPARRGERYESIGSIFAQGEALAGLLKQVAGQPMSKVRPIFASHHLTIAEANSSPTEKLGDFKSVNPDTIPGSYYVTNIMPIAPGQAELYVSPKRFWWGSEPVRLSGSTPLAKMPPNGGFIRVTPGPSTPAPPVKPTPTTSS